MESLRKIKKGQIEDYISESTALALLGKVSTKIVDIIDYNYNITRDLDPDSNAVFLTKEYISNTTKVYLNGMRLTRGNYYDYREGTSNIIIMNYPLEVDDLLTVDYKTITI